MGTKTILCVDMDAFFASVEQASNPNLRGKPMAVIGAKERSVILTSSYEARKLGVKTGMNKFNALKVCPNLILVEAKGRKYTAVSSVIAEILKSVSSESAMYSVDEAFLDITGSGLTARSAAYMIKSMIKQRLGITCTIGAGPNRLVAKMATHINKPDGYYEVDSGKIIPFMDSFKLPDIWGIGRKSAQKFNAIGIYTPSDLRNFGEERLENLLGIPGKILYKLVSGESETSIPKPDPDMKSIGHSMTLCKDIAERSEVASYLLQLSHMVSSRARKHHYFGKTVTLTVRFTDMSTMNFSRSLHFHTASTRHIYEESLELFDKNIAPNRPIRLLGVALSGIGKYGIKSASIEDVIDNKNDRWNKIYSAVDDINMKFGDKSVGYASTLTCSRRGATVISPSWQPDGVRNINIDDN